MAEAVVTGAGNPKNGFAEVAEVDGGTSVKYPPIGPEKVGVAVT